MAKIVSKQMPAPWNLPPQICPPRAKATMQEPQGKGKLLLQIPGGAPGMVMAKIDSCIKFKYKNGKYFSGIFIWNQWNEV